MLLHELDRSLGAGGDGGGGDHVGCCCAGVLGSNGTGTKADA